MAQLVNIFNKNKTPHFCTILVQIFGGFSSFWWIRRGSNSLPPPCHGGALPGELRTQSDFYDCIKLIPNIQ